LLRKEKKKQNKTDLPKIGESEGEADHLGKRKRNANKKGCDLGNRGKHVFKIPIRKGSRSPRSD